MDEAQTIINKRLSIYQELDFPELYGEAFKLCSDRLDLFSLYPEKLEQWEDGQFKKILRELKLITGQEQQFIFIQSLDYTTDLTLIEIQIWEGDNA